MSHRKKVSGTCIAVIRNNKNKLVFAGDRRASWGWSKAEICVDPKVLKRDGLLFGGTGESYLIDIITKKTPILETTPNISAFDYMHDIFFDQLNKVLVEKGWIDKDGKYRFPIGSYAEVIVGIKSELYSIIVQNEADDNQDLGSISIYPITVPYTTGCGGDYAMGSLDTSLLLKPKLSAKKHLTLALQSAAKHSPGCDANIDIIEED